MNRVTEKAIALGITGGIAAYKTAELVRLLVSSGYRVHPLMTAWATQFLGPLTLAALSGQEVQVETPGSNPSDGIRHISLVREVDLFVIAPATANTLAKLANGLADNFLSSAYLAHRGQTLLCPAMNSAMLEHPATRRNLARLSEDGVDLLFGREGELACGETGAGRMAEPAEIFDRIEELLAPKLAKLMGKRVLITAGPTLEDIDPVRFVTNRSSGKMGFALARAFRDAGAAVTLVHGPVQLAPPPRVEAIRVRSAADMATAVFARAESADILVLAAAVADYRPDKSNQKLKKENWDGTIRMSRTTDILATLGERKRPGQILVGFAAETDNVQANAVGKLERKNLDFIFANDVSGTKHGFESDHNHIWAILPGGEIRDLGDDTKQALAHKIVSTIA